MVSVSYFFIMKNAKIVTMLVSSEYFKSSSVSSIEFFITFILILLYQKQFYSPETLKYCVGVQRGHS